MPILSGYHFCKGRAVSAFTASLGLGVLLGFVCAAPASAEPATAEGARKLTDALQAYVGIEPFAKGFLAIASHGESYDLAISFDSSKLDIPGTEGVTRLDRYVVHLTPTPDGTWAVNTDPGSIALSWTNADPDQNQKFDLKFADCVSKGVFDPKLMAFPTLSSKCASAALRVRAPDGDLDLTSGELTSQGTAKAGATGGVDLTSDVKLAIMNGKFVGKKSPGEPLPITFRFGALHQAMAATGVRTIAAADLITFVRDNASRNRFELPQDELKTKLRAALPLWEDLASDASLDDGAVELPTGSARIAHFEEKQALTGVVKDARYADSVSYSGLEIPPAVVPDWARSLVPSQASYDTKLSFSGLDGMADALIRGLDLTQDPPLSKMAGVALLTRFFSGQPRYDLTLGATAQAYTIKGQGQASINPEPQAHIAVSATGFDAVVDALKKSGDPDMQNGLMGLAFIKGLAKTGPDGRMTWNVSYDMVTNKVWVNDQGFALPEPQ